eukprot:10161174-Lingulodinium_polyedra.AAC.1
MPCCEDNERLLSLCRGDDAISVEACCSSELCIVTTLLSERPYLCLEILILQRNVSIQRLYRQAAC